MKICAYGMDGLITPMVKRFAAEGCLPNFERMIREGTVNQTFPSLPVWTPTNWATLSTGAHTGTHGATRWRVQLTSGERISSFDGRALSAERIWNAFEREGLKSVAVHYPAADPSGVKSGFVVDGYGHPGYASTEYEIAACQSYTTAEAQETPIEMDHDGTAVRRDPVRRRVDPAPLPGRGLERIARQPFTAADQQYPNTRPHWRRCHHLPSVGCGHRRPGVRPVADLSPARRRYRHDLR